MDSNRRRPSLAHERWKFSQGYPQEGGRPEAVAEVVNCWPGEGAPQTRLIGQDIRRYVTKISSGELLGPRKVGGKSRGVHRAERLVLSFLSHQRFAMRCSRWGRAI